MSDLFPTGVGAVLSADVAVPDHEREVRFYARVLSTGADPLWRAADLMNNQGMPIIGLGERTAAYASLPLQWMPHIQVADVEDSVRRALGRGGSVLMQASAEEGASPWAVLRDPNGAAFGIIPIIIEDQLPQTDEAANPEAPVGRIAWLDLTVSDAPATRAFYEHVVGWSAQSVEMKEGDHGSDEGYADYLMLGEDGRPAAGVCHARGVNAGLPPVWLIYLPVGDLDESLRRVEEEGGTLIHVQQREDGQRAYAVVQDPVGVYVALVPG